MPAGLGSADAFDRAGMDAMAALDPLPPPRLQYGFGKMLVPVPSRPPTVLLGPRGFGFI